MLRRVTLDGRRTISLVWLGVLDADALLITGGSEREDRVFPLSSIVSGYQTASDRTAVLHLKSGAQLVVHLQSDDPARVSVWKRDVRRMALAPPTFRDQALSIDDYERVLSDAATPPDQRIGAALALRAIDPEQGPTRIRVAADASADDAMREALNAAAEGEIDDSLLERAASRRSVR